MTCCFMCNIYLFFSLFPLSRAFDTAVRPLITTSLRFSRKRYPTHLVAMALQTVATIAAVFALALFQTTVALNFGAPKPAAAPRAGRVQAGSTDISSIGFGTWSWGNKVLWDYDPSADEEIYRAYRALRDRGVSLFDTADSYGTLQLNGRAEILLGDFERRYTVEREESLSAGGGASGEGLFRNIFAPTYVPPKQQVATKFAPYPWRVTRGSMVSAARASLKRLDQDKLAIAQLHWSTANYQPFQERALWEGIADVYDEGLCEAVGVSNYGPVQLKKIADYLREREVPLASAQVQFSLMTYKDSMDVKDACDESGCRLISYSPLCLGLLTGKYTLDNLPRQGNPRRQLFRELLPGAQPLLTTLEAVASDAGKTQSQVAINWAMCKGGVPIPGVRNLAMAEENLGAIGWSLSDAAVEELDIAASKVSKPMIQNIFQTK